MNRFVTRLTLVAVIVAAHVVLFEVGNLPLWLVFASAAIITGAAWLAAGAALEPDSAERRAPGAAALRASAAPPDNDAAIGAAVLSNLPDPVLVVDAEGRIIRSNKAFMDIYPQAQPGRLLSAAVRTPSLLDAVQRVRQGEDHTEVEFSLPPPDARFFKTGVMPLRVPGSRPYVMVVSHDVTAAKHVDRVRVDFIANASHELRTPLSSLAGFVETMRNSAKEDPEAQDRFLEIMQQQADRMRRLIDDLLSLSRVEIDEHVPPLERVNIGAIAEQVIDGLKPVAEQAGVEIRFEAEENLPLTNGSQQELSQVFMNLIDNAIKYGRHGGSIEVSVKLRTHQHGRGPARSFIKVAIQDHGEGIPQEDLPRLTERFYRVDPERSRKEGGTGLGLAIVKHIVNRHKGRLEIESELGRGSTFTVLIPVTGESEPPKPA